MQKTSTSQEGQSLYNPILTSATGCTNAAFAAALTAIGSANTTLLLSPIDGTGAVAQWVISSNQATPRNVTLRVPRGATLTVNTGITLTLGGPVVADDPDWYSGLGTLTFAAIPLGSEERYHTQFLTGYVIAGGLHATVGATTTAAFACEAVSGDGRHFTQSAAAVTYSGGDGTYWLIAHKNTSTALTGWTRESGTKYLWKVSATLPTVPAGSVLLAQVTVAASAVTVVTDRRVPASVVRAGVYNPLDRLYGATGDGTTDDTTALQATLTAASNATGRVWLPAGTYLTTASLTSLHTTIKAGPGGIKRGSTTFYVEPTNAQSNSLFVATTGNDANDGLTSSQPVATLAQALVILKSYGPALKGTWTIQVAAGTYSEGNIDFPVIMGNLNRVVIEGVIVNHPNVPTTIFDGTTGTKAYGLNFNSAAYATLSNLKFQNYTTYGVVAQDLTDLTCVNVHCATIAGGPGIKMQQGRLRVQGGIITACQTGVTCISGCTYTIGDPASASTVGGTQITNCTQAGIFVQEMSTGHADYCTITNCAVGIDLVINCRVHAQACVIINNATAGIRYRQGSNWFDNGTSAGFSGNTNNELGYSWGGEVGRDGSRTSMLRGANDQTLITTTGVFAAAVVKTYIGAIAADTFNNETKGYRMQIWGTITGTTNSKNITVNLAGSAVAGHTVAAGVTGDFVMDTFVAPHGSSGAQQTYFSTLLVEGQTVKCQQGSRSITCVTGAALDVTILNTVNGAGDTVVIRGVNHYYLGAA